MLILKKATFYIITVALSTITMGLLFYLNAKLLNEIIEYPHYEWYMYRVNLADSLKFSAIVIICTYSIYRGFLALIKADLKIKWKVIACIFSFFIFHLIFGVGAGGFGKITHPITISNFILYVLLGFFIPILELKISKITK